MTLLLFLSCITLEELSEQVNLQYQDWCASSRSGRVGRVYDGDTIFLEQFEDDALRLLGVSAPELESGGEPADCYGYEARDFLRELILTEDIVVEYDVECEDMYGRELTWIFLEGDDASISDMMIEYEIDGLQEDGMYRVLINELLIRSGYTRLFEGEVAKNIRYTDRLERAQDEAEAGGLGLWSACE